MFRRRNAKKKLGEGENPFLLTFSDFMASLLAIFILVLIVTLIDLEKRQKEEISVAKDELLKSLEDIQKVQDSIASSLQGVSQRERSLTGMLKGIQKELKERGIEIVIAESGTVLRIPEQQLQFALGKYEILARSQRSGQRHRPGVTSKLYPKRRTERCLTRYLLRDTRIRCGMSSEMGNWGLSTYRAISLWNFWTDKPGELSALKALRTLPADPETPAKPLISVSGYADTRSTHGLLGWSDIEK